MGACCCKSFNAGPESEAESVAAVRAMGAQQHGEDDFMTRRDTRDVRARRRQSRMSVVGPGGLGGDGDGNGDSVCEPVNDDDMLVISAGV
jgi:hypothetical protein